MGGKDKRKATLARITAQGTQATRQDRHIAEDGKHWSLRSFLFNETPEEKRAHAAKAAAAQAGVTQRKHEASGQPKHQERKAPSSTHSKLWHWFFNEDKGESHDAAQAPSGGKPAASADPVLKSEEKQTNKEAAAVSDSQEHQEKGRRRALNPWRGSASHQQASSAPAQTTSATPSIPAALAVARAAKEAKQIQAIIAEGKPGTAQTLADVDAKQARQAAAGQAKKIKDSYTKAVAAHDLIRKKKGPGTRRFFHLQDHLDKAGILTTKRKISQRIMGCSLAVALFVFLFTLFLRAGNAYSYPFLALFSLLLFFVADFLFWLVFLVIVDLKMFQRTLEIERVLPEYLGLASSNMKAGMTIDRALWEAVRPQFGVLAVEMERVAKKTMTGHDLSEALKEFSSRYQSELVEKTINLIIEGIEAGGNISDLLGKVAIDLQSNRLIRKELAANVMSYVIFIVFSAVVMAPFMFALSFTLLNLVNQVLGSLDLSSMNSASMAFRIFPGAFKMMDFQVFAYLYLSITAISSAMLISMIRKGNIKEGLGFVPVFIAISLFIYAIAVWFLSSLFSGIV